MQADIQGVRRPYRRETCEKGSAPYIKNGKHAGFRGALQDWRERREEAKRKALTSYRKGLISMVPRDRIELPTRGFSVPCSTN